MRVTRELSGRRTVRVAGRPPHAAYPSDRNCGGVVLLVTEMIPALPTRELEVRVRKINTFNAAGDRILRRQGRWLRAVPCRAAAASGRRAVVEVPLRFGN
jgi:hypothetical protein